MRDRMKEDFMFMLDDPNLNDINNRKNKSRIIQDNNGEK